MTGNYILWNSDEPDLIRSPLRLSNNYILIKTLLVCTLQRGKEILGSQFSNKYLLTYLLALILYQLDQQMLTLSKRVKHTTDEIQSGQQNHVQLINEQFLTSPSSRNRYDDSRPVIRRYPVPPISGYLTD